MVTNANLGKLFIIIKDELNHFCYYKKVSIPCTSSVIEVLEPQLVAQYIHANPQITVTNPQ